MDAESQRIYDRMTLHRQLEAHPDWSNRQLADEMNKSERWVRKWKQRFKVVDEPHFSMYLSQSCAPKTRQRETPSEVKEVIGELRETLSEKYHRKASATLIRHYLHQNKDLKDAGYFVPKSSRTINKVLREMGYIPPKKKREHLPLALCPPMEEWEMDFCEIRLEDGRFEFFLVVDRGTSRVVYLEGCEGYNAVSALMAVFRLFLLNGLPKCLRLDRDPRFVGSWTRDSYPSPLVRFLRVLGVQEVICPPRRPDKKPYVERCVRTFKEEWLGRFSLNTMADVYEVLEAFPHYHNSQRVHFGRACKGRTPDKAFPDLPVLPQLPDILDPNRWMQADHGRTFRRRVTSNGTIQVDRHVYYVDSKLAKQPVLVHLDAQKQCLWVSNEGKPVKKLPLKGVYEDEIDLQDYLLLLQDEARSIERYRQMVWQQIGEVA